MKFMEDMFLTHSVEIRTTPEKIFEFFYNLVDDESYRAWHPNDHVTLRWMEGSPWQEGSVVYAEEYFHGKLHKLTFVITKVVPNRRIEFVPVSRFLRRYAPKNTFSIEPKEVRCVFTSTVHLRLPLLPRLLARKSVERGVSSAKKHIEEEVENLKKILESEKGIT
ncbi:SRPBCC family protein [candidate division WOR-3 bacterium]|nr:SRPBCC family protein [candidate division WOR-3 bacterium]